MLRLIGVTLAFILIALLVIIYPVAGVLRFGFLKKIYQNKCRPYIAVAALIPIAVIIIFCIVSMVNTMVVLVHIAFFLGLCDLVGLIIGRLAKKKPATYIYTLIALLLTAVYLGKGWYNVHHVRETDYTIKTQKNLGDKPLRIVQISDSHVGATFHADGFAKHLETIQKTNPDIILFTGDFVDDDTTKEDMIKSCEALGKMDSTYGIYMIYGNHDKGYFNYRNFTVAELEEQLAKNNIILLQDETVLIDDRFYIVGRQDRTQTDRIEASRLMEGLDTSKYIIMLDHQPNDYDNESATDTDLVLSGHTHGGQLIPIGPIGELIGSNDATYGLEERNNTTFIVNSGISDWAIKFKTGTFSEYGVIDIIPE